MPLQLTKSFVCLKYNRPIEGCNIWAQILEMKPCKGKKKSFICCTWIKKPTPLILIMKKKKKRDFNCKQAHNHKFLFLLSI